LKNSRAGKVQISSVWRQGLQSDRQKAALRFQPKVRFSSYKYSK